MKVYRDSHLKNGIILVATVTGWGVVPTHSEAVISVTIWFGKEVVCIQDMVVCPRCLGDEANIVTGKFGLVSNMGGMGGNCLWRPNGTCMTSQVTSI